MEGLIVRRLAIVTTTRCTLRCKLCSNFMPKFSKPRDVPRKEIIADGHNPNELMNVLRMDRLRLLQKPLAIIADTIKGKGTALLENKADAHEKKPSQDEYKIIFKEFGISKMECGIL